MTGDDELAQLAKLLRIGAETARQIASIRIDDQKEVCCLADRAEAISDSLEDLLAKARLAACQKVH